MSSYSYTYLIRCEDDSLYCGYTTDINRRVEEHKNGIGSKYVRSKKFKKLEIYFVLNNKKNSMNLERRIKKLSKIEKETIILNKSLPEKILTEIDFSILDIK